MYGEKGVLSYMAGVSMYEEVPGTMQQSRAGKSKARPEPDSLHVPEFDREF